MIQNKDGSFSVESGDVFRIINSAGSHDTYVAKPDYSCHLSGLRDNIINGEINISSEGIVFIKKENSAGVAVSDLLHLYDN